MAELKPTRGTGSAGPAGPVRSLFWLTLATGLLALLRLWRLGEWSLWLDEALTLSDWNHLAYLKNPLGYVVFGSFYRLLDTPPDEAWLRLPAALFGIAGIAATWWAFRREPGGWSAHAAALVVAASSWHLYWSQTARFYTLVQFLGLLGIGLYLRGIRAGRPGLLLAGLASVAVGALCHPSAAFLFAGLLLAPPLLWILRVRSGLELGRAGWGLLLGVLTLSAVVGLGWGLEVWETWSERTGSGSPLHFIQTTGYYLTPGVGLLFGIGLLVAIRRMDASLRLTACVTLVGLGLALGASFFVRVSAQYVFVLLPLIALVACAPLERVSGSMRSLGLVLLLAFSLVDGALYFTVRGGDRGDWRGAYDHVFEHMRPDDLVLGMEAPVAEYYWNPRQEDLRDWRRVTWLDDFRDHLAVRWARYPRRTWFVINPEQMFDWSPEARARMRSLLEEDCRLVWSRQVGWTPRDLDVEVWLREAR